MSSALVRALVQVLKKSASDPKPNLDPKNIINIMKLNVRSLDTISQLPDLTASTAEHNKGNICVQEARYYHSELEFEYHYASNRWTFVSTSLGKKIRQRYHKRGKNDCQP